MHSGGPEPGTLVGGSYRVGAKLGDGAMGVVLLAHDELLDRRVAIKFMRRSLLDDAFRARFRSEALAMARVSHPNVVQIHSLGEHDNVPYFVMEYVEGTTLESWHRNEPNIEVATALDVLDATCHGVGAIHAANTLHRDIKPSNILLDAAHRPKIADLGLAMLRTGTAPASEVAGTPAFMAPEIGFQRKVDPAFAQRADVYSLGCVAYELLTGKLPFSATSPLAMIVQHGHAAPPAPSSLRPELGPGLDHAILRALAKDPADRTPSAEAFRRDLLAGRDGACEPTRILLADDNDDFRELMVQELSFEFPGAEIVSVADGAQALVAFDAHAPSVVIIDLQMPGLHGMELTALIRARKLSAHVPILVLTASGATGDWQRLSALGADRFLVKPVVIEDVVALVRRSLRERTFNTVPPQSGPVPEDVA